MNVIEKKRLRFVNSTSAGLSALENPGSLKALASFRDILDEIQEQTAQEVDLETVTAEGWNLVLYNDEHNTFDHVIEMLISICGHDAMQAEQCALLVHFKGKCTVMAGTYDELEPKCTRLLEADLTAEIEA